jgi:hypothetical protein
MGYGLAKDKIHLLLQCSYDFGRKV